MMPPPVVAVTAPAVTPISITVSHGITNYPGRHRRESSPLGRNHIDRTAMGIIHRGTARAACQHEDENSSQEGEWSFHDTRWTRPGRLVFTQKKLSRAAPCPPGLIPKLP